MCYINRFAVHLSGAKIAMKVVFYNLHLYQFKYIIQFYLIYLFITQIKFAGTGNS